MNNATNAQIAAQGDVDAKVLLQSSEVSLRLLEFVAGAQTEADFTRERFRHVLQLPPQTPTAGGSIEAGAEDQHIFSQDGSSWTTEVAFFGEGPSRRVEFRISHPSLSDGSLSPDLTSGCALTLAKVVQVLRDADFLEAPSRPASPQTSDDDLLVHYFSGSSLYVTAASQVRKTDDDTRCIVSFEARLSRAQAH